MCAYKSKIHPTVAMQYINWDYMASKESPLFNEIIEMCEYHGIKGLMGFKYSWNQ